MNNHHRPSRATQRTTRAARRGRSPRPRTLNRRGVVGILAMMFLVLFASLATTMAVVTQGNLRSAVSHLRVTRAISGIDTGMEIAFQRLDEATGRFMISRGEIDAAYALHLWNGTYSEPPAVDVLPAPRGRVEPGTPAGIMQALRYHHEADNHLIEWNSSTDVPAPIAQPETPNGWLVTQPIGLERNGSQEYVTATQISYGPPDLNGRVTISVTGYNWDFTRERWVSRTAQQSVRLTKRLDHAIISPSRIMLGRNVQINGPLGISYTSASLNTIDGSPLYVKSDFYGLDPVLNDKLDDLFQAILDHDVDGDNRLRIDHKVERGPLIALNAEDYDNDGIPDSAFGDATLDGAVDEYDLFLNHFGSEINGAIRVVLSAELTDGTAAEGMTPDFTLDDALAMLIDSGYPDRNRNGLVNGDFVNGAWDYDTFPDNNDDGLRDGNDVDLDDRTLGYRDGFLDYRDRYAKIRGTVFFRATRQQWEAMEDDFGVALGDFQREMMGAIDPSHNDEPVIFEATETELPTLTPDSFRDATAALRDIALSNHESFDDQVAAAMGGGWTPPTAQEATPYGSPTPADWYERPVYEGITFENVVIPMGNNGLFIDCTFVGVTFVDTYADNTHPSWTYYGMQSRDAATGTLVEEYPYDTFDPGDPDHYPLDQSFYQTGMPLPENYAELPPQLNVDADIDGDGVWPDHCTDTKRASNNIRFHDCLFVGSIVSERAYVFHNRRNKIQFTGRTRFATKHPDFPDDPRFNPDASELLEIRKSSLMLPHYSVDIGTNNSDPGQAVELNGAIVAGVLDIRGNAVINGILMTDFTPLRGAQPFDYYGEPSGDPADINITIGYLGPSDGDMEGYELADLTDLDGDGTLDIGWDSARDPGTGALIDAGTVSSDPNDWPDTWFDGLTDGDADFVPGDWVKRAIPFNGYGRIIVNWNPDLPLPDGLATPTGISIQRDTYEEGRLVLGN